MISDELNDSLSDGAWLVVKNGNCTTTIPVKPDFVEVDAALNYLIEGMVQAMLKESEMRPSSTRMSKKEIKAWKTYEKTMGKDKPTYFVYSSMCEIAHAGRKYLRERIVVKKKKRIKKEIIESEKTIDPIMALEIL